MIKYISWTVALLLWIHSCPLAYATAQIPDQLRYKGQEVRLFANPLEQWDKLESIRPKLFGSKPGCASTACWRNYMAHWEIIAGELYLLGIYSCCFSDDKLSANLKKLFGEKCINGKVKADWFSGEVLVPEGKLLRYEHMGYGSIYEKERIIQLKQGRVITEKIYDNSKSRTSVYETDSRKLLQFIYKNIVWHKLPQPVSNARVFVQFSANEQGIIDKVEIVKSYDSKYNNEAIRVVRLLSAWSIIYSHGKFQRMPWTVPITFSEENRKKYSQ
ncbi:energy transducer TonB family protein [Hymenobacter cellulosivorans]|uniref:Energy transducer TonB n=1 Tax=Hymenobacter cellulosivorans TaxID=2932249 RepID=A0ABY4FBX3_9BACT|nr:energy transducer TonB [Hymenobacter cellulosivorans]UOQ51956.1 energy transducer TonB [Hymenobacter cellulosivorans]